MKRLLTICAVLVLGSGSALADPVNLGICQALVGDETTCEVTVDWDIEKTATPDYLLDPDGEVVQYTITVTEGESRYALDVATVVSLTGLVAEGTQVRGLTISLQRRPEGGAGYTTVASARVGDLDEDCGCPFVDNGALELQIRDAQGQLVEPGGDALIEHLAYGESADLYVLGQYDLSTGVILPGDDVRVSTCIRYASVDELDRPGCSYEGGGIRTTRACSAFDFSAWADAEPTQVAVTDALEAFEGAFVTLSTFIAQGRHPTITPTRALTLDPGDSAVFAVEATGVAGTVSVIDVNGVATCAEQVDCAEPVDGRCESTLVNTVSLSTGASAAAAVTIACSLQLCPAGGCDDANPCTNDLCAPSAGCVHTPTTGPSCSDGNACTSDDACVEGACVGETVACQDDGDPCTIEYCDPSGGCTSDPAPGNTPCDDGNACTVYDLCQPGAGSCGGGQVIACDDGNPCTVDSCDPAIGCVFTPREGPCDDGSVCTVGDVCAEGQCIGGPPLECSNGAPCRGTYCDPVAGCVTTPTDDGAWCDDGDGCTGCPWPEPGADRGFMVSNASLDASLGALYLPSNYVLWMSGFFGGRHQVKMGGLADLRFLWFPDGTAYLRGTVAVSSTGGGPGTIGARYALEVKFQYRGTGFAGQGSGGPHRELPPGWQGFEYTDGWEYFDLISGTLRGLDTNDTAELTVRPAAGVFPFQMGVQANDRNGNYGGSAWFYYARHTGSGQPNTGIGDINLDMTEVFCGDNDVCDAGACQSGDDVQACGEIAPGDYCTWRPNDYTHGCQAPGSGPCLLEQHFRDIVSGAPLCNGDATLSIGFTSYKRFAFNTAEAVRSFLHSGMMSSPPVGNTLVCNPHNVYSTSFSRELLALKINVLMSDRGLTPSPHGHPFGDLVVDQGGCMDLTVREVLFRGEKIFSGLTNGGTVCASQRDVEKAIRALNKSFQDCGVGSGFVVLGSPWVGDGVTKATQVIVAPMPELP